MSAKQNFRRLFRLDNDKLDVDRAVDDELAFHFDTTVRELIAKGANEADAKREAELRFGDVERTRHGLKAIDHARVRDSRRIEWFENVLQDLRYALRGMRRKPAFTISVVLILALGIGANATMFGIIDRLLFRPPAFLAHSDRVQRLYFANTSNNKESFDNSVSYRQYHEVTDSAPVIDLAAGTWSPELAIGTTDAREVRVTYATASFWKFFDVRPAAGRFFTEFEDVANHASNVVVLSYSYWNTAYGGRADAIGSLLRIGRFDYTIIGVAPQGFSGFRTDMPVAFLPLASGADNSFPGNGRVHWYDSYGLTWMTVMVRRKADVSIPTATASLTQRFLRSYAQRRAISSSIPPEAVSKPHVLVSSIFVQRGPNQDSDVKVTVWLVGVAFVVLIIACANVSNLMLARALQRRREIAVRLALGISRTRLFTQLITETVLLALLGGIAGLAVTEWGGRVLRSTLMPTAPDGTTLGDARTLLFSAAIAIIAGLLCGLAPALRAGRGSLTGSLKAGSREGTYQHSRLRWALLVLQGALSVVLLVGAGLFVRSIMNVEHTRLGYDADHLAWVQPALRGVKLDSTQRRVLDNALEQAAQHAPGVLSASLAAMVPFYSTWTEDVFVAGIDSTSRLGEFVIQLGSPSYFATTGTRILRGRGITADDRSNAPKAVVVSESMAKALWPGKDAMGQCIRIVADTMPCRYVVGIAEDVKYSSIEHEAGLQYYLPADQYSTGGNGVFIRTAGDPAKSAEAVRVALQKVMPGDAYVTITSLSTILGTVRRSWELGATMFTLFGVLALLVASVGLYSVISYSVAQRTQEMGVRVALGAQQRDVLRLILGDAMSAAVVAIALGVVVALLAGRWVSPLLFKTSPYDPTVYGVVALTLLAVAIGAGTIPALRAARVSPTVALRSD